MRMLPVLQPFFTWAGTKLFIGRIEQFLDDDALLCRLCAPQA